MDKESSTVLGHLLLSPKATKDPAQLSLVGSPSDDPVAHGWDGGLVSLAHGTCSQDLLREAAEEQHGAGNVAEVGDEPVVPDVLQLQAALAALRDLLVLQHLVEDLVGQQEPTWL